MNKSFDINEFIKYCESTEENEWCVDVVRTRDGKNCLFGHLFAFAGNDYLGCQFWDMFEECWATTYMVYPVNDGENERYQQKTPKQRCVAYLKNLRDGLEKTTHQIMEEDYKLYLASTAKEESA